MDTGTSENGVPAAGDTQTAARRVAPSPTDPTTTIPFFEAVAEVAEL
jgi:hypothetical protein